VGAIEQADITTDGFFQAEEENADEKRIKLTKKLIKSVEEEQKEDKGSFFMNLMANTTTEADILGDEDDIVKKALKYKVLEQQNKLFYNLADSYGSADAEYEKVFLKGHKKAITCLEWLPDNSKIITASKDCNLALWDLQSQTKTFFKGEKFNRAIQGHFDEVCSFAVSPNGKFLVSGGKDRVVRVWDIHNQKQIQTFLGHRDTITGITFDKEND
jgi:WD40 repeat protein